MYSFEFPLLFYKREHNTKAERWGLESFIHYFYLSNRTLSFSFEKAPKKNRVVPRIKQNDVENETERGSK